MCTIMTMPRKQAITKESLAQILADYNHNPHGSVLLLDNSLMLTALEPEVIIDMLQSQTYTRMWLHQRYASTETRGLSGCHNFITKDRKYAIMHNGCIDNPNFLPVDSQQICELYDVTKDISITANVMVQNESFANIFYIKIAEKRPSYSAFKSYYNDLEDYADDLPVWDKHILVPRNVKPREILYTVSRSQSGTLYTDGNGNYSSSPIKALGISEPVKPNTIWNHYVETPVVKTYKPRTRKAVSNGQSNT